MPRHLTVLRETWPLAGVFTISRGSRTEAKVLVAEIRSGDAVGRGECVPYARYGESLDGVAAQIAGVAAEIEKGAGRDWLQTALPAGAARNALDCALWDLEAKQAARPIWELAGLAEPGPVTTAFTISLDAPDKMAKLARAESRRPLLKLKLTGEGDLERLRAIRAAAPDCRLIVDANEAWSADDLAEVPAKMARLGVEMIEQPLPADADDALLGITSPVAICADESCHDSDSLPRLAGKYDMVNIKLDKAGGLTEALKLRADAQRAGFGIMVGCMVGTSLAMAPAMLVAQDASLVDLDGPLWMKRDREPGLEFIGSEIMPPRPELWG